jgi:hypothetical protein
MRSYLSRASLFLFGLLLLLMPGCKEKEPDPDRPKVTRPKLPEIPQKPPGQ